MAELINITPLDPNNFSFETYQPSDEELLSISLSKVDFDPTQDYIEYYIYDLNGNIVYPNSTTAYQDYTLVDNKVTIDPEQDVVNAGFDEGTVNTLYNFYIQRLASNPLSFYYIKEISSDRTELRLATSIDPEVVIASTNAFIEYRNSQTVFPDFYLNFGNNRLVIANNILLDTVGSSPTVLIKLYEPLPQDIAIKTQLWVVEKLADSLAYQLEFSNPIIIQNEGIQISGPNFNLSVKDQINNSTDSVSLSDFTNSYNSQSQFQLNSYFNTPGVEINVDYSDFNNFVFFSSAYTRLENFFYKVQLIQTSSAEISALYNITGSTSSSYAVSSSVAVLNQIINDTITNFDGYEYYLYFETGSNTYPKTNNTPPYTNSSFNSVAAQSWITSSLVSASVYDNQNQNYLRYSVPEYIREDPSNESYILFIDMIGQFFDDNLWVYIKDVTNKYDRDNRIDYGVSKDLVAQILRDLGVNIYQNNYSDTNLYSAFLGFTVSSSLFPFPYVTSSLPTPTGYEYVNTFISASNEAVPLDDINKRIYKRLYHNLPYLLKKKGTFDGVKTLIDIYGIPNSILRISEFGGKDKDESLDWDYWQAKYNYKFDTRTNGWVQTEWALNSDWGITPAKSLELRFKTPGIGSALTYASQSLWSLDDGSQVKLVLEYTGSGYASGSYSGSTTNPYNEYANLKLIIGSNSASVYLPFFNGEWWSVGVTVDHSNDPADFILYAADNIYNGDDGSTIGFIASSSVNVSPGVWNAGTTSYFPSNARGTIGTYRAFTGSYQEVRYYTVPLNKTSFINYVMNSDSTEGNGINTSPDQLAFRASLGGELYTGSVSIHPKVTGSWIATSSFASDSNFTVTGGGYTSNTETIFLNQPAVGIKNSVSNKIQIADPVLPSGNTLSNQISIEQKSFASASYTENINTVEVTFSPQNEINDDITNQIGFFNIGEYIGDPRLVSSSATTYPALDALSNAYFEKYTSNYDWNDYTRLIRFFDNSLFKMLQDFVPARTSLISGVVIKQHLLERNKYPVPQVNTFTTTSFEGSGSGTITWNSPFTFQDITITGSIDMVNITGSNGGVMPNLRGQISGAFAGFNIVPISQSWSGSNVGPSGSVPFVQSTQEEFFNGELSGSEVVASNGELNEANLFKNPSTFLTLYDFGVYTLNNDGLAVSIGESTFLSTYNPGGGEAYIYNYYGGPVSPTPTYGNKWLKINKTDLNGNNNTLSLQELTVINLGTTVSGVKQFIVESISERATYFLFLLTEDNINTSVISQGDLTPDVVTVLEPFESTVFYNSDDNVLYNNVLEPRRSTHFFDVDYSDGINIPTNQQAILSGSAVYAPVQDYNWNLRRSTIPRYSGSKVSSQYYNVWTQGDDSYGKEAAINYYGNVSFDVSFVGGTYPEMAKGTAINITKANIYTSPNESVIIDQNNSDILNFMIDQYLGYSQSAQIFSNDVSPIKDNNIVTLDGQIGWPANSNYFVPRQQTWGVTYDGVFWTSSLNSILFCSKDYVIYPQVVEDSRYATASFTPKGANTVFSASLLISQSIASGGDWYITLYSGSSYPLPTYDESYISGGLDAYNSGSLYNYSNEFSLQSQGVYKIISFASTFSPAGVLTDGNAYQMTLNKPLPDSLKVIGTGNKGTVGQALSMLIWKSNPFPQSVILETRPDYFPSGIGEEGGYVIPDDFNDNLKSSIFALKSTGVTTTLGPTGQITNTLGNGSSYSPFGIAGKSIGESNTVLRLDGLSDYYVWDGIQWNYSYTG